VISLKRIINIIKVFVVLLIVILIYGLGYIYDVKYNNKDVIDNKTLIEENRALRNELSSIKEIGNEHLVTRIIYRDIYNFYKDIIIDNKDNLIEEGDLVINKEGLIGVVDKVMDDKASFKLIDRNYHVSVKVNDTYGDLYNGYVVLLNKYENIKIGDEVFTSGIGYLKGDIYVGKVSELIYEKNTSGVKLKIKLADNKNINYVGIISNK